MERSRRVRAGRERILFLLPICLLLGTSPIASTKKPCSASPISKKEAEHLLHFVPAVPRGSARGGKISLVDWKASAMAPADYFFEILSDNPTGTVLGNGVLGYFGVSNATATALDVNLDPSEG